MAAIWSALTGLRWLKKPEEQAHQAAKKAVVSFPDVLDSGMTFFPPLAPEPHGTDEFVRAALMEGGGSQRAALQAWDDIKAANHRSVAVGRAAATRHHTNHARSEAVDHLQAILGRATTATRHSDDASSSGPVVLPSPYPNPNLAALEPMAAGIAPSSTGSKRNRRRIIDNDAAALADIGSSSTRPPLPERPIVDCRSHSPLQRSNRNSCPCPSASSRPTTSTTALTQDSSSTSAVAKPRQLWSGSTAKSAAAASTPTPGRTPTRPSFRGYGGRTRRSAQWHG